MSEASASYVRDLNLDFVGDDNSRPSASSSASQDSRYRTGDYYTISGHSNIGLGIGKIVVYGLIGMGFYWLYKRMKRG